MPARHPFFGSKIHADLRSARRTLRGVTSRKEEPSKRPAGKSYPRMPRILLPTPAIGVSLDTAFETRHSFSTTAPARPFTLKEVGSLLLGLRDRGSGGRPYPSGGARYPIETYIICALEKYAPSAYHYFPAEHALEELWPLPEWVFGMGDIFPASAGTIPAGAASGALVFTAAWERNADKYGDFSYLLSTLEAGHMAQNVLLAAAATDIKLVPWKDLLTKPYTRYSDLEPATESPIYAIALLSPQ